jgi:hypothetical protein
VSFTWPTIAHAVRASKMAMFIVLRSSAVRAELALGVWVPAGVGVPVEAVEDAAWDCSDMVRS